MSQESEDLFPVSPSPYENNDDFEIKEVTVNIEKDCRELADVRAKEKQLTAEKELSDESFLSNDNLLLPDSGSSPVHEIEKSSSAEELSQDKIRDKIIPDVKIKADFIPTRVLPAVNTKEKIILVIDRAKEDEYTCFKYKNKEIVPLETLKRSLEMFLHLKHSIDSKHEFALMELNENTAKWRLDFTNNVKKVIESIRDIKECAAEDIFDLNTIFNVLHEHLAPLPVKNDDVILDPPYIVRLILIYNRSYTLPELDLAQKVDMYLKSPYFTVDIVISHEPIDESNNAEKISKELQKLNQNGFGYVLPVERNLLTLQQSMAKLLGHPLQRPIQQLIDYSMN